MSSNQKINPLESSWKVVGKGQKVSFQKKQSNWNVSPGTSPFTQRSATRLDLMVAVMERQIKLFRQLSTDGGFAGPHRAGQKQTARRFHAGQI